MRVVGLLGQQHGPGDSPPVGTEEGGDLLILPKRLNGIPHHRRPLAGPSAAEFCANGSGAPSGRLRLAHEKGGDSQREINHRSRRGVSALFDESGRHDDE